MPSLQHAVVAALVGRLRRNLPPDDVPAIRAALTEENRRAIEGPPSRVRRGHEERIGNDAGFAVVSLWTPTPDGAAPGRTLLYLHGGAFVHPTDPRQWAFAVRLADTLGARLVVPLYPLAPEFTVEDSFEAVVDLTAGTPGLAEAAERDPWLSLAHLPIYAEFWAGSSDPAVLAGPRLSPGLGDLSGLPRALMLCGTRDLLQPGCDALFARAEESGWDLTYVVAPGLVHVYPLLPIPEARGALDSIVEFCLDD